MIELVLAAALMLRDPPGDAVGAGGLVPPSAEQYRNPGSFDLLEVQVLDSAMLAFAIEMAALPNPAGLANGFSNPVIDVYVDLGEGGAEELLPGPEMRMPAGRGWEVALRITGDGATAYRADDDPTTEGPSVSYPVRVQAEERVIRVETPFERPEIEGVYALTGVYDPFVASGWRPLAETPSPWAFASSEQRRPVIDLLAPDEVAQADAIRTGVLPMPRNRTAGAMWMLLMAVGVLVAGVGLVLRRMVGPQPAGPAVGPADAAEPVPPPAEPDEGTPAESAPEEPGPTPVPAVTLPTFLPALPPAATASRGVGRSSAAPHARPGSAPEAAEGDEGDEADDGTAAAVPMSAEPPPRAPEAVAIGEPDSWLDDPEEDPDARTWRGEPEAEAGIRPEESEHGAESAVSGAPVETDGIDAADASDPSREAGVARRPKDGAED